MVMVESEAEIEAANEKDRQRKRGWSSVRARVLQHETRVKTKDVVPSTPTSALKTSEMVQQVNVRARTETIETRQAEPEMPGTPTSALRTEEMVKNVHVRATAETIESNEANAAAAEPPSIPPSLMKTEEMVKHVHVQPNHVRATAQTIESRETAAPESDTPRVGPSRPVATDTAVKATAEMFESGRFPSECCEVADKEGAVLQEEIMASSTKTEEVIEAKLSMMDATRNEEIPTKAGRGDKEEEKVEQAIKTDSPSIAQTPSQTEGSGQETTTQATASRPQENTGTSQKKEQKAEAATEKKSSYDPTVSPQPRTRISPQLFTATEAIPLFVIVLLLAMIWQVMRQ